MPPYVVFCQLQWNKRHSDKFRSVISIIIAKYAKYIGQCHGIKLKLAKKSLILQ